MNRLRASRIASALLLGAVALGWTMAGETSNPQLTVADLPAGLVDACAARDCGDGLALESRWIGRTPHGDLFIVAHKDCNDCSRWLLEKTTATSRLLLELNGHYELHRGSGAYPAIELRTRDDATQIQFVRYEWDGNQYTRTVAQQVYEVNGVECGTREECQAAAKGALEANDTDRALVIWQQVWGISWI
jgi:hypothetical protein